MYDFINLIIPFIALVLYSKMIDKLTEVLGDIMLKVKWLPDSFEASLAYLFILAVAFLNCWQADWSFFSYLDINYKYDWENYLASALVISGGSAFVREGFSAIETIPMSLQGIASTVRNVVSGKGAVSSYEGYSYSSGSYNYTPDTNTPTI